MEPCNQNKNVHDGEDDGAARVARAEALHGKRMEAEVEAETEAAAKEKARDKK